MLITFAELFAHMTQPAVVPCSIHGAQPLHHHGCLSVVSAASSGGGAALEAHIGDDPCGALPAHRRRLTMVVVCDGCSQAKQPCTHCVSANTRRRRGAGRQRCHALKKCHCWHAGENHRLARVQQGIAALHQWCQCCTCQAWHMCSHAPNLSVLTCRQGSASPATPPCLIRVC